MVKQIDKNETYPKNFVEPLKYVEILTINPRNENDKKLINLNDGNLNNIGSVYFKIPELSKMKLISFKNVMNVFLG